MQAADRQCLLTWSFCLRSCSSGSSGGDTGRLSAVGSLSTARLSGAGALFTA